MNGLLDVELSEESGAYLFEFMRKKTYSTCIHLKYKAY
jgi:hypothetical protein